MNKKQIQNMVSNYNIGKFISYEPTPCGCVNNNYIVKTTKGKYILRVYMEPRKLTSLMYEAEFTDYLRAKKFPYKIPQWLTNKSGKTLSDFKDLKYLMYEYIPGNIIERHSDNQIKQVAKIISITHKAVLGFKPKNNKKTANAFSTYWQRNELNDHVPNAKKQNTLRSKILLKNEKYYRKLLDEFDNKYKHVKLTKYIIHNDFNSHNILFQKNKISGLIDFDNCRLDFRVKDLAQYMIYGLNNYLGIDFRKIRMFIKEYKKYSSISDKELKCIPSILLNEQIGAFMWTYDRMERGISKINLKGMKRMQNQIKWIDENRDNIIEALT
jgi:homoserine kinase type II